MVNNLVSIPKRVSEFLKRHNYQKQSWFLQVSIPKRVSEFLKRTLKGKLIQIFEGFQSLKGFQSF